MRGAEFSLQAGEEFDPKRHLTRADVKLRRTKDGREYAVVMMRPAKGKPGSAKDVPLVLAAGGTLLDPVAALKRLWAADPVPAEQAASTPLFRHGSDALTVAQVRAMVKALMGRLGLDPRRFGAHSLRIGGATAGLAAKLSEPTLRAAGRWSGLSYRLYTRASREAVMDIATIIGSTAFEDAERGFIDEELMVTRAALAAAGADDSMLDADMLERESASEGDDDEAR